MVRCCLVRCGMIWYKMVCYGMVRCGIVWVTLTRVGMGWVNLATHEKELGR